ncbi:MAG: hypothetical protein ACYTBJ_01210 [Planctomycetota bacterium]
MKTASSLPRCASHEDITRRLSAVEANTQSILKICQRLDDRTYETFGEVSRHKGAFVAASKVIGIVIAAAAAGAAVVKLFG